MLKARLKKLEKICESRGHLLSSWERDFAKEMVKYYWDCMSLGMEIQLTAKQSNQLLHLINKYDTPSFG